VAGRRTREREDSRLALIEAARDVLREDGYDGLTIRRVAERAEYGLGTVYTYFTDKDDLLYALVREDFARLTERLRSIRAVHTGVAAVREMLLSYVRMGLEQPASYEIMFMLRPRLAGRTVADDRDEHAYAIFRGCIADAIVAGELRAGDPDVYAQTLWAAAHGLVSLQVTLPGFPWAASEALADTLVAAQLRGLAP
jgi:AcrR family transcriptional regulator